MTAPGEVIARIAQGIELGSRGEREAARRLFATVWSRLGEHGDPFHRMALAHSMADVQDDPRAELEWDLRALRAADSVTDERAARGGVPGTRQGLYPSLHLNLAEDYRKLGQLDSARHHLHLGRAAAAHLGSDGYAQLIRSGLDRLAEQLAANDDDRDLNATG